MSKLKWNKATSRESDPAREQPKRDFVERDRCITPLPEASPPPKDDATLFREKLAQLKKHCAQLTRDNRAIRHQQRMAKQTAQKADRDKTAAEIAKILKR